MVSILVCRTCRRLDPGPRIICPNCYCLDWQKKDVSGEGKLVAWTTIKRPPNNFENGPYNVAVVELDAGIRITCRLESDTDAAVGDRLSCKDYLENTPIFAKL